MINIENLTQDQKELVDIIGADTFEKLVRNYGGSSIYIPKLDTLERQERNKKILDEYYSGKKLRFLAMKYNLTETQIRCIIGNAFVKKSEHVCVGQMSIFDE